MEAHMDMYARAFPRKTLFFALTLNLSATMVEAQELFAFSSSQGKTGGMPDKCLAMTFSPNQIRGIVEYDVFNATTMIRTWLIGESPFPSNDLPSLYPPIQNFILSRTDMFKDLGDNRTFHVRSESNQVYFDVRTKFSVMMYGDSTTNEAVVKLNSQIEDMIHLLRKQYPERAQSITQRFERAAMPARETTISEILKNASAYNGKRVRITGYYRIGLELNAIVECEKYAGTNRMSYARNPEKPTRKSYQQSLWLGNGLIISEIEKSKADAIKEVFGKAANTQNKIWVEGLILTRQSSTDLYDSKSEGLGHLGMWDAAIDDISDAGFE